MLLPAETGVNPTEKSSIDDTVLQHGGEEQKTSGSNLGFAYTTPCLVAG